MYVIENNPVWSFSWVKDADMIRHCLLIMFKTNKRKHDQVLFTDNVQNDDIIFKTYGKMVSDHIYILLFLKRNVYNILNVFAVIERNW